MFCTTKKKDSKDKSLILGLIKIAEQVETLSLQKNSKVKSLILGLIKIAEQVETLSLQKILRTEASSSVRSKSPSKWKPYRYKKF